jgi:DNA ligase-1
MNIDLWTRGEEFVSEKFPEIINASKHAVMSDIILDGELLFWDSLKNMPEKFQILQKRLGQKKSFSKRKRT